MTLTLELTPEQEHRVREEAARKGLDTQTYAIKQILGSDEETVPTQKTPEQLAAIKRLRGSLAQLPGSVDDFIAEKRKEMEREDRF